jgi:hypothetical protein
MNQNHHTVAALIQGVAPVLHEEIEALKAHIAAEIQKATAPLLARIAELESSAMKYCGVHQASIAYRKGCVTTFDGAAWCATRDVSVEKPGRGHSQCPSRPGIRVWRISAPTTPPIAPYTVFLRPRT